MPVIRIDFDDEKVKKEEILALTEAIQKIVSEVTSIADVFVYANSSQIKYKIAPIEVFVEMSASKISDADTVLAEIKNRLSAWKKEVQFEQLINLTLTPANWKIEIGI